LLGPQHANKFVRNVNGNLLDIYTATKTLSSAESLREVFDTGERPAIYLVMNPEVQSSDLQQRGSTHFNGEINLLLEGYNGELVYSGAGGREKIWRYAAPSLAGL